MFSGPSGSFLSKLLLVTITQNIFGLIPRGTHRADRFMTPHEMEGLLRQAGLQPLSASVSACAACQESSPLQPASSFVVSATARPVGGSA